MEIENTAKLLPRGNAAEAEIEIKKETFLCSNPKNFLSVEIEALEPSGKLAAN